MSRRQLEAHINKLREAYREQRPSEEKKQYISLDIGREAYRIVLEEYPNVSVKTAIEKAAENCGKEADRIFEARNRKFYYVRAVVRSYERHERARGSLLDRGWVTSSKTLNMLLRRLMKGMAIESKIRELEREIEELKRGHREAREGDRQKRSGLSKTQKIQLIQKYKKQGERQRDVAEKLNISLRSVKSYWHIKTV